MLKLYEEMLPMPIIRKSLVFLLAFLLSCGAFAGTASASGSCVSGDCENGSGVMTWPSGHRYEGTYQKGQPSGAGAMYWPNGQKYSGEFRKGQMIGKGQLIWPDGQNLSSNEWNGLVTGQGLHTRPDGRSYSGVMKDNRRAGLGIVTSPEGRQTQGYWSDTKQIDELTPGEYDTQGSPPSQPTDVAQLSDKPKPGSSQIVSENVGGRQKVLAASKKQAAAEAQRSKISLEKIRIEKIKAEQEHQNDESLKGAEELKALTEERMRLESQQAGVSAAEQDSKRIAAELKRIELIKREQEEKRTALARAKEELAKLEAERTKLEDEQRRLAALEVEQARLHEERERIARQKAQVADLRQKVERMGLAKIAGRSGQLKAALVIGNSSYAGATPLANPVNDAQDMGSVLQGLGFDTTVATNASKPEMEKAIAAFGQKLKKGGMGLFFFAGHGLQVAGENYLVPTDAVVSTEADVAFACVKASKILNVMEDAKNDLNIIILDACRNNPFSRGFSRAAERGLAKMDAPMGALLAYSTAPGKVASDGSGRNGLYTKYLLANIAVQGLSVEEMFKRVRQGVASESSKKQVPWEASSLIGDFTFAE